MNGIEQIIENTIGKEGRYSNKPNDSGGETMWGITAVVARANGYTGAMINLPRERAVAIYTQEFFIKPKFDQVLLRSPSLAEELFDTHVNTPYGTATKFLQRALNWFNRRGELYPDLVVDGGLGKNTLDALDTYLKHRKSEGELVLLRAVNALQAAYYGELSERRQKDEDFVYGWLLNRVVI